MKNFREKAGKRPVFLKKPQRMERCGEKIYYLSFTVRKIAANGITL